MIRSTKNASSTPTTGMTTSAIANKLFLSTHTIDSHRENIKRKLALKNAGELTRAAVQWLLET